MANQLTQVWIKKHLLSNELASSNKKETRKSLSGNVCNLYENNEANSSKDYEWVLGSIVGKETNDDDESKGFVTIMILDEDFVDHYCEEITVSMSLLKSDDILMANHNTSSEDLPPHDLIHLTHLHEPAVVHCLKKRYEANAIYTATGPILLAVNPFKKCRQLYDKEEMNRYRMAGNSQSRHTLPPHVFGIADTAFRDMIHGLDLLRMQKGLKNDIMEVNQSILVSGESGAGKTVSTKHIMRYLANLSLHHDDHNMQIQSPSTFRSGVEKKILESNPILESFGNARTIRNDNSSRFGKFIELQFQPTKHLSATLIGAKIETYLLEKVRLVNQGPGERNYHIFYELLQGMEEDDERRSLFLNDLNVNDFKITSMSGTFDRRDQIEDYETYDQMRDAMSTMGFTSEEQIHISRLISAILHASNLTFDSLSADECKVNEDNDSYQPFLNLMGLSPEKVNETLCYVHVHARGEMYKRTLSKEKATKGLEALVKATYGSLFNRIVELINRGLSISATKVENCESRTKRERGMRRTKKDPSCFIGVLDIFGFESFDKNSFEQLCINYCNEALQQQFNLFVFTNEQQEYEKEGIDWAFIEFPDNQDVLELIEQEIVPILDDHCRTPRSSDEIFAKHIYKRVRDHPRFSANHRQVACNNFGVLHYAGLVEYDTAGFMEKNKDEIPKESTDLLLSSTNAFVRQLAETTLSSQKFRTNSGKRRRNKLTVGGQFIKQLRSLRERIGTTHPHYVRCLKPNSNLVSGLFNPAMIADQLRHAGVLEAVRVTRVGFPHRYTHSHFFHRYFCLSTQEIRNTSKTNHKSLCESLIKSAMPLLLKHEETEICNGGIAENDGLQIGRTKVFLRRESFEKLESLREIKMEKSCTKIQTIVRLFLNRLRYCQAMKAVLFIQAFARKVAARDRVQKIKEILSTIVIQKFIRMKLARKKFLACHIIARWGQKMKRGVDGRIIYSRLNRERQAIRVQKFWRRSICVKQYNVKLNSVLKIQCTVRVFVARLQLYKRKTDVKNLEKVIEERNLLQHQNKKLKEELEAMKAALNICPLSVQNSVHDAMGKLGKQNVSTEGKLRTRSQKKSIYQDKPDMIREARKDIKKMKGKIKDGSRKALQELSNNERAPSQSKSNIPRKNAVRVKEPLRHFNRNYVDKSVSETRKEIASSPVAATRRIETNLTKRKYIRVGGSKFLKEMRMKARQEKIEEMNQKHIKIKSRNDRENDGNIDRALLSNMISLLESRKNDKNEALEKLKKETEQLKASFKNLKRKMKSQKSNEVSVHHSQVRAPAMSCTIGPTLGGLFAQKPNDTAAVPSEEKSTDEPKEEKKFLWWNVK